MAQTKVKLGERLNCLRCEHEWQPRQEVVTICPKCKSPYWNVPRTMKKKHADSFLSDKEKYLRDNGLEVEQ